MILDANALSAFIDADAEAILGEQRQAAIPVIVPGELRYGFLESRHCKTYERWLGDHLKHFDPLAIAAETTLPHARVRAAINHLGRSIPVNDAWIAVLAIQYVLPIPNRDGHFDGLPSVRRIAF